MKNSYFLNIHLKKYNHFFKKLTLQRIVKGQNLKFKSRKVLEIHQVFELEISKLEVNE